MKARGLGATSGTYGRSIRTAHPATEEDSNSHERRALVERAWRAI